ncbi:MAG: chemotaxis protein CheW [Alphaproteobacteria bacterium]|nr:chemotaxis protein CheW [Alphaproteobacteria bacterium]
MSNAAIAMDLEEREAVPGGEPRKRANQFVTFYVGENAYGIDIMAVREIRSWTPTTVLPDQAYGARGVLDIRGKIVEVFDLSLVLGSGGRDQQANQVVLVVAIADRDVGLAVDSVSDIVDAADGDFAEPPAKGGKVAAMVRQNEQLISILDLDVLFN